MLSCRDITQKANDYLEKDLPFAARMNVKMHLLICIHCRRYIKQLQTTIHTLGRIQPPAANTATEQQIQQVVELLKKHRGEANKSNET